MPRNLEHLDRRLGNFNWISKFVLLMLKKGRWRVGKGGRDGIMEGIGKPVLHENWRCAKLQCRTQKDLQEHLKKTRRRAQYHYQ